MLKNNEKFLSEFKTFLPDVKNDEELFFISINSKKKQTDYFAVIDSMSPHYNRWLSIHLPTYKNIFHILHIPHNKIYCIVLDGYYTSTICLMDLDHENNQVKRVCLNLQNLLQDKFEWLSLWTNRPTNHLTYLDLSYNNLQDTGVMYLSEILTSHNTKLEELLLVDNNLRAKGMVTIAQCLCSEYNNIKRLNLARNVGNVENGIHYEVACAFETTLQHPNNKLKYLNLSKTGIGIHGMDKLICTLPHSNNKLESLYLDQNSNFIQQQMSIKRWSDLIQTKAFYITELIITSIDRKDKYIVNMLNICEQKGKARKMAILCEGKEIKRINTNYYLKKLPVEMFRLVSQMLYEKN